MSGQKRINIAETKLKILEIMSKDPEADYKRVKSIMWYQQGVYLDYRTVKKYMAEMETMLSRIKTEVEQKIKDKAQHGDELWNRITSLLK